MMITKHKVMIKGTKDGLIFMFDDRCSFEDLIEELATKMESSYQQILTGPLIHVTIKLGNRYITEEQEEEIRRIIGIQKNLVVKQVDSNVISKEEALLEKLASQMKIVTRTVRSGQVLQHEGDILLLADVNPGGCIISTGNVFVMGKLMGMAHAGYPKNIHAVIGASYLQPTQLRIGHVIGNPLENLNEPAIEMGFAYIQDGKLTFEKIRHLHKIKPELYVPLFPLSN
ncbi:septum site-determining protein MinC [Microaerobacter geothermalis]|uniref:septum site-determining protein MinC n=1 Tax=Microaerobacter geothermalis TaxID=674972 RepID=UPI001F1FC7F1|nr:septum site-determining protein MinC [Microaerobacter geothermalis]MCF6092710.1 septum site-determining protein MinC [Microaerobacter geothermalis]